MACLLLIGCATPAQAVCIAQGTPINPAAAAALARGFNLSGWMENESAPPPDAALLTNLKAQGFTHVRLPVNGALLMARFTPPAIRAAAFERLDATFAALRGMGYAVSLDMHPDGRFAALHRAQPDAALGELKSLWRALTERYAAYPADALFFELLNEPAVENALWRAQADELVRFLRPLAPQRLFIIGPATAQRIDGLTAWTPLEDANVAYAVHFYDPLVFTHQGLTWEPDNPIRLLHGVPFPVDLAHPAMVALLAELGANGHGDYAAQLRAGLLVSWGADHVRAAFDSLGAWRARHGRPVIVNEFGVLAFAAPAADRKAWLRLVAREAERICAGWAHWDLAQGFGMVNSAGQLDQGLVDALLGR